MCRICECAKLRTPLRSMDAIRPGRSIAAVFEPRCGTGRRAISRILDQFGDHAIPGGHARPPAPRNRGGATRCIDNDLRKDDLRPSAITRTTDNAAVRRDADCAQPANVTPTATASSRRRSSKRARSTTYPTRQG